jgi:sugar porter (SP) family MFS transporter
LAAAAKSSVRAPLDPLTAVTGIILIVTPIASGFTQTWVQLTVVRLLMGIGVGAKAATVPMYCAELSPARIRGALTMGWQLWTAFGIFLGFCANAAVMNTGKIAWRLQLGSAFIPAVPLTLFVYCCPESPRWYMKKGRMGAAWTAMKRLRFTELQAARDLFYAYVLYAEEQKIVQGATYFSRLAELFTIPRCRRATVAASVVMIAQQMCGINIMAFYSSTIFKRGGFTDQQALFASIGFGALNFLFAIPAVFTIDTFGRRALLLTTFPIMCITLLIGGFMFLIDNLQLSTGLVALFIYLFTIAYSVGEGPVPFMYSAEVFPLPQREQGMAWAVMFCFFWGAVLSFTFPVMLRAFTPTGAFAFYAGMNALAFVMIFLWVPETKQLTLEELDNTFSVKTNTYIRHNFGTVLPWWFKRYILRNKSIGPCPPIQVERPRRLSLVQTLSREKPVGQRA